MLKVLGHRYSNSCGFEVDIFKYTAVEVKIEGAKNSAGPLSNIFLDA
jgi:hypothetical protein